MLNLTIAILTYLKNSGSKSKMTDTLKTPIDGIQMETIKTATFALG
jgi:hypothetical protein